MIESCRDHGRDALLLPSHHRDIRTVPMPDSTTRGRSVGGRRPRSVGAEAASGRLCAPADGGPQRRPAAAGRAFIRLDCLAGNARLNAYYLADGYRLVGHKAGKPQPGGAPKSFTLLEKTLRVGHEV